MFSAIVSNKPGPFEKDLISNEIFFFLLRFNNLIIVELREEFRLEDFEIYGGVVYLTLRVDSVKDYVVNTLVDKVFLPQH